MAIPVWKLALLLASMPTLALAEHAARQDPADPASPIPSAKYESAFTGYQSFQDQKPASWKDVNTEVTELSGVAGTTGHAGHSATAEKTSPIASAAATVVAVADTTTQSKPVTPKAETPAATGVITATGVVQQVDKANA